jgi:Zn-dependent protease
MDPDAPGPSGPVGIRIAGIPVSVPWSGILGVLLIAWLWSPQFDLPGVSTALQYGLAAAFAVLLYVSILVHEGAHAVAARSFGYRVTRIVLWVLGGFTVYERERTTPGREAVVAAVGPLATAVIAVGCWAGARATAGDPSGWAHLLLEALAFGNGFMAVYNLLPGLPLDGGAVVKALVWGVSGSEETGTVVAGWCGRIVALLVLTVPLGLITAAGGTPSVWLALTAAIFAALLWTGASEAIRRGRIEGRLPELTAVGLARRAIPVDKDVPLAEALRRLGVSGAGGMVVVDHDGRPMGIAQEAAVAATPEQRRPWVPVSSVARTLDPAAVLVGDLAGRSLLEALQAHPAGEYLVVDGEQRVVGVLTATDVERALGF